MPSAFRVALGSPASGSDLVLGLSKPSGGMLVALLVVGIPVVIALAVLAGRLAGREVASSAAGVFAGAVVLVCAVAFPYQFLRTVHQTADVDRRLSSYGDRAPGYAFGSLDVPFLDRVRAQMRPTDRYLVVAPRTDVHIRAWPFYWYLPRVATSSKADADWVIGRGVDPSSIGLKLGKIQRGSRGEFAAPVRR
jgi:hypothetical protein